MADSERTVDLVRLDKGRFRVTNVRGGTLEIGDGLDGDAFTPVELLLAALGGCAGLDVDAILGKRSAFVSFTVNARGDKVRDDDGNHLVNLQLTFDAQFPDDEGGQAAAEFLPAAMAKSHDRICTVSRTVQLPTPVEYRVP